MTEVWSPVWSHDGKSLFYVSNRGGSEDLWVQELSEGAQPKGDPEAVTTGLGIRSASLNMDGTKVAYSKGSRFANIWRVPIFPDRAATWSDAEQLTFDQAHVRFLDVSPDGRRLAFNSNRSGVLDLWTLPAEGGEIQPLTNDPTPDWNPVWSPDGKEIVFYSNRAGNRDLFVISSDGGPARQLSTHEGGDFRPSWSPDGRQIVYQSAEDGNHDIWVMPAAGNGRKQLTDGEGYDSSPDWSPDGQWIAFGSDNWVWRVAPEGGEPERLSQREGLLPQWDPDGKTLYSLGQLWRNEYWALSLEDRTERLVADLSGKPGAAGRPSIRDRRRVSVLHVGGNARRHLGHGCRVGRVADQETRATDSQRSSIGNSVSRTASVRFFQLAHPEPSGTCPPVTSYPLLTRNSLNARACARRSQASWGLCRS